MILRMFHTLTVAAGLLLAGCTIAGQWEAAGDTGDFQLARATFNKDKTYEATGQYKGQTRTSTGKYSFNGSKLTLTPDGGGPQRSYDASLDLNGKTLNVKHKPDGGEPVKVAMKKVGCCKDCPMKNCPCCKKPS